MGWGTMNPPFFITRAGIPVLSVPMILPWTCMQTVLLMNPVTEIAHITTLLPCSCEKDLEEIMVITKALFCIFIKEWKYKMELITELLFYLFWVWVFYIFCKVVLSNISKIFKFAPVVLPSCCFSRLFLFLTHFYVFVLELLFMFKFIIVNSNSADLL